MNDICSNIFTFWGLFFSEPDYELYDAGVYQFAGIILLVCIILSLALYYPILDPVKYNRRKHWTTLWLGVSFLIVTIVAIRSLSLNITEMWGYSFGDFIPFLFVVFLSSALLFFILSLGFKRMANNTYQTPF